MADLLLELFSEEIPARMQVRAAEDLQRLITEALRAAGLTFDDSENHSGPRRLTCVVRGLKARSADVREERKGPRVGAPDAAVAGFLRGAGLDSLDQCQTRSGGKGDYYVAVIDRPGRPAADIVAEIVPEAVRKFPWPKAMRWGTGRLRWVRPLHGIVCLLDDRVVPFAVDGIAAGRATFGHRTYHLDQASGRKAIAVKGFTDYAAKLRQANVILARPERRTAILTQATHLASREKLGLIEDHGLLDENAGLVEWPVVLSGRFDESFLEVPPEVLMTSMKTHQKCFSLTDPATGRLTNRFLMVANIQAKDGGKAIVAGNERVIRARLADARFFWDNDRKRPLDGLVAKLDQIIFHEKLGSLGERVGRCKALARKLAPLVDADADKAGRAVELAKADLLSETVGEFPELQGVIGRYIALEQGEDPDVAEAIAEHYKPQGPSDAVPTNPVSIAVSLADKLDMLAGFWAIGEKPTGSKDPYGLRRAALGVIRIVLENDLRVPLATVLGRAGIPGLSPQAGIPDLISFFADRLKVHLRDQGTRHDLIDAVFSLPGQDDLLMIVRRVEALGRFLATEDGEHLLTGMRRAQNILRIEEKKDRRAYDGAPKPALFTEPQEKALAKAIAVMKRQAHRALQAEDFEGAMAALARLRAPVDGFFDAVTVNADDLELRENRLKLLSQIRAATLEVADFSKIEG